MPRLRHRQTKGAATVERYLPPPRQSSTLPTFWRVFRLPLPGGGSLSGLAHARQRGAEFGDPRVVREHGVSTFLAQLFRVSACCDPNERQLELPAGASIPDAVANIDDAVRMMSIAVSYDPIDGNLHYRDARHGVVRRGGRKCVVVHAGTAHLATRRIAPATSSQAYTIERRLCQVV